jgi:hypothetical protein
MNRVGSTRYVGLGTFSYQGAHVVIVIGGHDLVIGNCRQGETPMAYKTIQTQTLTVAKTDSIKRGFVKQFVDFIAKKGKASRVAWHIPRGTGKEERSLPADSPHCHPYEGRWPG